MTWLLCALALPVAFVIDALLDRQPWAWRLVRDTGVHRYFEHPDGRRRVQRVGGGYQPIDQRWLAGGEWTAPPMLGRGEVGPFDEHDRTAERQRRDLARLRSASTQVLLEQARETNAQLRARRAPPPQTGESGQRTGMVPSRPWVSSPRTGMRIGRRTD